MSTLIGKLVGAHFRPPAKAILGVLPSGAALRLTPEPENQYDSNAVKVEVQSDAIRPESYERLASEAIGYGFDLDELVGLTAPMAAMIAGWHYDFEAEEYRLNDKGDGAEAVFSAGKTWEELCSAQNIAFDPPRVWHLGYIDSKKTGAAAMFAAEMKGEPCGARLGFDAEGSPIAVAEFNSKEGDK